MHQNATKLNFEEKNCIFKKLNRWYTVVSGRNSIVGLYHLVTIGIHISIEISKTNYPGDLTFDQFVKIASGSGSP